MKTLEVKPLYEVNGARFGCNKTEARSVFGSQYKEIYDDCTKGTIDVYEDYHVCYSEKGFFEAIEIFGRVMVTVRGTKVFPGVAKDLLSVFPDIQRDIDGWTDKMNSVGVTLSQDDEDVIEAILFGCRDYYLSI